MSQSTAPTPGSAARRAYGYAEWAILSAVYSSGGVLTAAAPANEVGVGQWSIALARESH